MKVYFFQWFNFYILTSANYINFGLNIPTLFVIRITEIGVLCGSLKINTKICDFQLVIRTEQRERTASTDKDVCVGGGGGWGGGGWGGEINQPYQRCVISKCSCFNVDQNCMNFTISKLQVSVLSQFSIPADHFRLQFSIPADHLSVYLKAWFTSLTDHMHKSLSNFQKIWHYKISCYW